MIDITPDIKLPGDYERAYRRSRLAVYFLFLLAVILAIYRILFPSEAFTFSFRSANSLKNTVMDPRTTADSEVSGRVLKGHQPLIFNTNLTGNFSDVEVEIATDENASETLGGELAARKSFRSYFYQETSPIGMADGSLVKIKENHYIVSDNTMRRFVSLSILPAIGYTRSQFEEITAEEFALTPLGEDISTVEYVNDMLFKIDGDYYRLSAGRMERFISEKAFLSQYDDSKLLLKDGQFLANFTISEDMVGFADGTLLASPESAFVVSGSQVLPVINTTTFESMGYDWNDLLDADADEIGLYEKGKLLTKDSPHPDGTIFVDKKSDRYHLIRNGKKAPLLGEAVIRSYLHKSPIVAETEGLEKKISCVTAPAGILRASTQSCKLPLQELTALTGNDYEFVATFDQDTTLEKIDVTFRRTIEWRNITGTLSDIKKQILQHYEVQ